MPARNRTLEQIASTPADQSAELPEWAKPPADESASEAAPIVAPVASATPALDNLLEWLVAEADDNDGGTAAAMEAIVRQTLSADNMAQALRQTLPQSASQFVGMPMLLNGFTIRSSDYDEGSGPPFYASLQVMAGNPPEPRVINIGGWKPLAQIKVLSEIGTWPMVVKIVEAAKAKKGQSPPLMLVAVDEDA